MLSEGFWNLLISFILVSEKYIYHIDTEEFAKDGQDKHHAQQ